MNVNFWFFQVKDDKFFKSSQNFWGETKLDLFYSQLVKSKQKYMIEVETFEIHMAPKAPHFH